MNTSDIIVVAFFSIIIIFSLYMYKKTSKAQKQAKEKLKENMKNKGASLSITLPHLIGLIFQKILSLPYILVLLVMNLNPMVLHFP